MEWRKWHTAIRGLDLIVQNILTYVACYQVPITAGEIKLQ